MKHSEFIKVAASLPAETQSTPSFLEGAAKGILPGAGSGAGFTGAMYGGQRLLDKYEPSLSKKGGPLVSKLLNYRVGPKSNFSINGRSRFTAVAALLGLVGAGAGGFGGLEANKRIFKDN